MSFATPAGTRGYFERLKAKGIRTRSTLLGSRDLMISRIGFGGYRIHEFDPEHREALRAALRGGVNLIDTSANYTDGSSERMIGEVTSELFQAGELRREEIVFVTKAGYVQGSNLKHARELKSRGEPYPEMVEFQEDCWHNISPAYLERQITLSLERLRLERLDFLLLHNPEYFFKSGGNRDAYYQRIERAFIHLESECKAGRIQFYGVSSNTLSEDAARSDFTSLERIHEIAKSVAGKNSHFALVQFPLNLYESAGALKPNNGTQTALALAEKLKLGILTNRPFNAYYGGRLTRLSSFARHDEVEIKGGLHVTLGRAIELEKSAPGYPKATQGLCWAHMLRNRMGELDDLIAWREVLYQQIYPSIRQALSRLNPEREKWANDYQANMQELLKLITWDLENLAADRSRLIEEPLVESAPELATAATLSQKLLRLYTGLSDHLTVLVGMRTPAYVEDVLRSGEPLNAVTAREALARFQRHRM